MWLRNLPDERYNARPLGSINHSHFLESNMYFSTVYPSLRRTSLIFKMMSLSSPAVRLVCNQSLTLN